MTQLFGLAMDGDDSKWRFMDAFIAFHNHHFGTTVDPKTPSYDIEGMLGITTEDAMERVELFLHDDAHHWMEPLPGVLSASEELAKSCRMELVTNRCCSARSRTDEYITQTFPHISRQHFCNGYTMYGHPRIAKADVCKANGLRAITEDNVGELVKAAEAGIWGIIIRRRWHTELPQALPERVIIPESARLAHPSEDELIAACWAEVPDIVRWIQKQDD